MTDLTEKWKNGELEDGWYYILNLNNVVRIEETNVWIGKYEKPYVGFYDDSGIKEVLAPVPSYDELQELKSECKSLSYGLDIAVKRNRYLLRLLKECKDRFVAVTTNIPINLEDCDLINRMHQEVYDLETEL